MKRRAFFRNLVGSFAVLVAIYSTPVTRFKWWMSGIKYGDEIVFGPNSWAGLIKRGKFPVGIGDTIRVLTYEKT